MPGSNPSRPGCVWWIAQFWSYLAMFKHHADIHCTTYHYPWAWWCVLACSICLVDVWWWIDKLSKWVPCLDQSLPGLGVCDGLPNFDHIWPCSSIMQTYIALPTTTHEPDDVYCHVPFALWMYGNGLTSYLNEFHVWINPFQALICVMCDGLPTFRHI